MNSFLRNVASGLTGREGLIKESLTNQLSSSVKEIQLDQSNRDDKSEPLGTDDVTNTLCIVLEALFIHGLKDTFMNRVTQAIKAGDIDQRPEPTFWAPLLIFSHREIIDQVNGLFLVSTDVGRCRAWLRLALNDGLLSSYFGAMRRDGKALKPYYHPKAFVRDADMLDIAQRLVEGIDNFPFALACNSSLLNIWTNQPLLLAGLWTPPLVTCPVAAGIDVASTLAYEATPHDSPASSLDLSCASSSFGPGALDEDEALKIILRTPMTNTPTPPSSTTAGQPTDIPGAPTQPVNDSRDLNELESSLGNSLTCRLGWSSSFEDVPSTDPVAPPPPTPAQQPAPVLKSPTEVQSYHSLLESYNMLSGSFVKTPDFRDIMQRFDRHMSDAGAEPSVSGADGEDLADLGYEVIANTPNSLYSIPDFALLVQQLGKLSNEHGLDVQNFACATCSIPIGINFGKANVCAFTGSYNCSECHKGEEWVIPAKVIQNWDYQRYFVCHKSAAFLDEIQHHPLLDLKVLNPRLYLVVDEMAQLQALRIQLNLLRAYLFTCREPVIEQMQKRVWPREYLYEHVHLYSVGDLLQIPSGSLAQLLSRVVAFARDHVINCWLCSQKGFICEVCNNTKVIYPFDTDTTYRCSGCSAVFHKGCLDSTKPCPKCRRKEMRDDLPLMEASDS